MKLVVAAARWAALGGSDLFLHVGLRAFTEGLFDGCTQPGELAHRVNHTAESLRLMYDHGVRIGQEAAGISRLSQNRFHRKERR